MKQQKDEGVKIDIKASPSLHDIESNIRDLSKVKENVKIRLPRKLGSDYFIDTWLFAYLNSLYQKSNITIVDRHKTDDTGNDILRFEETIEGLAAIRIATSILSDQGDKIDTNIENITSKLKRRTYLENALGIGKKITCVAWDPSIVTPPALLKNGMSVRNFDFPNWSKIIDQLRSNYANNEIDFYDKNIIQNGNKFSADEQLKRLLYEIYQNAFKHGRKNYTQDRNPDLNGIRFFRIGKHIATKRSDFITRCSDFEEARSFIENSFPSHGTCKMYEIAISDCGLGIAGRFMAKNTSEISKDLFSLNEPELINLIIRENLSSDKNDPTSGLGLTRTLAALDQLKGFVSLRTGGTWLYRSPHTKNSEDKNIFLEEVSTTETLNNVVGTHYNILIPIPD